MEGKANSKIFALQANLVCGNASESIWKECIDWFKPYHLDEVVEERANEGVCGNPNCSNSVQSTVRGSKAKLKLLLDEREKSDSSTPKRTYCSIDCTNKVKVISSKLLSTSTFSRPGAHKVGDSATSIDSFIELLDGKSGDNSIQNGVEINESALQGTVDAGNVVIGNPKAPGPSKVRIGLARDIKEKHPGTLANTIVEKMNSKPVPFLASEGSTCSVPRSHGIATSRLKEHEQSPSSIDGKKAVRFKDSTSEHNQSHQRPPEPNDSHRSVETAADIADRPPLVVGLGVSTVPMPSDQDRIIWEEIFGTPFVDDNDDEFSSEVESATSGPCEQRAFVTLWSALDDLFESDIKAQIQISMPNSESLSSFESGCNISTETITPSENRPLLSTGTLAQFTAAQTFLERALSAAERLVGVPRLLKSAAYRQVYAKVKAVLFGNLRAVRSSEVAIPSLRSSQWNSLGLLLIDAIVRLNSLQCESPSFQSTDWSTNLVECIRQLHSSRNAATDSLSDAEIMLLRSYFD